MRAEERSLSSRSHLLASRSRPWPSTMLRSDLTGCTFQTSSVARSASVWEPSDPLESNGDAIEEPLPKAGPFLIFEGCFLQLLIGLRLDNQGSRHYFARRPSIRCFTSSQGTPSDSPARTRRARRSISAAQAPSTSSSLSAGCSSRLASSSAATSARSVWGSFRASCKRASRVMSSSPPSGYRRRASCRERQREEAEHPTRITEGVIELINNLQVGRRGR